jgi:hypothetical protein
MSNYPKIEKPTGPGHYFYRVRSNQLWSTLNVRPGRFGNLVADWPGRDWPYVVREMDGEWRGPIPEPTS